MDSKKKRGKKKNKNGIGGFLFSKAKKNYSKFAERLTIEEINEYQQAFSLYDRNADGTIDEDELLSVLRSLGQNPTEREVQDILNQMDGNRNGKIEFHEFLEKMVERNEEIDRSEDLRNAFRVFDKNGDGRISLDELRDVMLNLGDPLSAEEVKELMNEADQDHNGFVNYEEFVAMMSTC